MHGKYRGIVRLFTYSPPKRYSGSTKDTYVVAGKWRSKSERDSTGNGTTWKLAKKGFDRCLGSLIKYALITTFFFFLFISVCFESFCLFIKTLFFRFSFHKSIRKLLFVLISYKMAARTYDEFKFILFGNGILS